MEEVKINVEGNKKSRKLKTIIFVLLLVVVIFLGYDKIKPKNNQVTISSKSELVKELEISELNSARYYYNGIAKKENNNGKAEYYVSYEGTVTVGIDFKDIIYEEDPVNKKIIVKIPDLKITSVNVEATSLDFIKLNTKLKDENIHNEAYNLASKHLENTIETDKDFYKKAKKNAEKTIRGLIEPLIKAKDNEYKLEIQDK